jgi:peroxiredoxin
VDKSCDINQAWNRSWYFYEDTSELVVISSGDSKISQNTRSANITNDTSVDVPRPRVGMKAPDFALNNLDGKSVRFSDLKGKMVMLDFWIYQCSGCREKLEIIQQVFNKLPSDKYAVLCINVREREALIRTFAASNKISVPILFDTDGKIADLYKINGFPTTYIIDGSGIFKKIDIAFENSEELEKIIVSLNEKQ